MKTHIYSAFGAMRIGMDLLKQEKIKISGLVGHGGIFKTPEVGQQILAAALQKPVTVMETAGEGGAWGMAVLGAFSSSENDNLNKFLKEKVFAAVKSITINPNPSDETSYNLFIKRYREGLDLERQAAEKIN